MAAATLPTAGSPTLVKTAPVKPSPIADEMITPPALRRFLDIPLSHIEINEIFFPLERQYRVEHFDGQEIEKRLKQNEKAPIWIVKDGEYFRAVDGYKRLEREREKSLMRECHCKPATISARVLDLTPKEAKEIMDEVDTRENALFAFGQEEIIAAGTNETLTCEHFAYTFAKQRVHGRVGRFDAAYLDELLADANTSWDEEEIYSGYFVWKTLDALRWWLETLCDIFGTNTAMASADPTSGKPHELQTALLEESKEIFALSQPAIEEQVRLGWLLLDGGDAMKAAKNTDYSFPCTVALMRAYRAFASRAADAVCEVFSVIDRKRLSLII
jgi:hypothetical protein